MKCDNCGCERETAHLLCGLGFVCSRCAAAENKKALAIAEGLAREPLNQAPVEMGVAEFERWTLKLAVHTIRSQSPRQRAAAAKRNPLVLVADYLALHFKEKILQCMSTVEYQSRELHGHESLWASGEFWFKKPVKFASVKRAAFEAGLISEDK
jgi:hypothetical protein